MPGARIFIDSTTFLCTIDIFAIEKRARAQDWLLRLADGGAGLTNLQVLNEVTNVLQRRAHRFDRVNPFDQVDIFADFGTTPVDIGTVSVARNPHQRYRYSWWDCLLLASALELGCSHFLSEDLQNGQTIEGLTIVNPFAHSPDDIF